MILHAEKGQILVAQALVGVVIEIQMCDFDFARRERVRVDAKTMILCRDLHLIGQQVFNRMVRTVVAKFQLEGSAAKSEAAKLVAETDAE